MEDILHIKKENAIKAYDDANGKEKILLENLFGKKNLVGKITDQVKTFDDALDLYKPSNHEMMLLDYSGHNKKMVSAKALLKLQIIIEVLNNGWTPDWNDSNQKKWYPWFKMTPGFAFTRTGYGWSYTGTGAGSRLCFETEELARYAGTQFESIYKDLIF